MSEKLDALMKNYHKKINPLTEVVVFHVCCWWKPTNEPTVFDPQEYTVPVASMELYDMENDHAACEEAFVLTNSISKAWYKNTEITKLFEGLYCRSTSTGDVITVSRKDRVNAYKCDAVGWSITDVPNVRTDVPKDQLQMSIRKVERPSNRENIL